MPTTPNGIVYPLSAGLNDWSAHLENIATTVEAALAAREAWQTWPLVFADGPTTIGAGGVSKGHYVRIGNRIHAEFLVVLGTGFVITPTVGWELVLPVVAYDWGGVGNQVTVGTWAVRDNSAATHYAGTINIHDAASDSVDFAGAWDLSAPNQPAERIDEDEPITWAVGDFFSGTIDYRAAS